MFGRQGIMLVDETVEAVDQVLAGFKEAGIINPLTHFSSTAEAIAYLESNVASKDRLTHPLPCFIFLGLTALESGGLNFLHWIRKHPQLKRMPVVAFAHQNDPALVGAAYDAGANSVLVKPVAPEEFLRVIKSINGYWVILVEKPTL